MNPMLREMLMEPVGWLTIIGALIIFGLPVVTVLFIRHKMRQDERNDKDRS